MVARIKALASACLSSGSACSFVCLVLLSGSVVVEIARDVGLFTCCVLLLLLAIAVLVGTTGGTAGTTTFPEPSLLWLPILAVREIPNGSPRLGGFVKKKMSVVSRHSCYLLC